MGVIRALLFQTKAGVSAQAVEDLCSHFRNLKETCVRPDSGHPYLRSIKGGADISTGGMQGGFTHVFLVEFDSTADRDYYALNDPSHQAFIDASHEVIEKVQILDVAMDAS